ncbi:MAG: TatD family hydrolase [Gammaproteobacteria bacterium]|nr:TatD family hydrolase [Gammaproteobacteria bacterium]MBU1480453.1 TatD family hydrolase [Gammaproteobacteria bacterium]
MFIDTHCHLDAAEFGDKQANIVRDAAAVGVTRIVVPSVASSNFKTVRDLCKQYPGCSPAYGIHPMYTDTAVPRHLDELRDYLKQHKPVAVGEIGLDFFIPHYDRTRQEHFFVEQLKLARDFDLPVLLHIRRAQDTILKHLRQIRVNSGIAHAFNGSRQQAEEFIKLGFKLGFGGAMTYSRATKLRELAATLPPDSIVLETDAPDIPPDFLEKGLPNEPKYLPRIAQTLADLRGLSLEEVEQITTENSIAVMPALKPTPL